MRNRTDDHTGNGAFVMGLMTGIAAGAALATLYAPSSGREMRHQITERAREGRDRVRAAAERGREQAMTAVERGRSLVHEGREALEQGREVLSTAIDEGRDAYRHAKERGEV